MLGYEAEKIIAAGAYRHEDERVVASIDSDLPSGSRGEAEVGQKAERTTKKLPDAKCWGLGVDMGIERVVALYRRKPVIRSKRQSRDGLRGQSEDPSMQDSFVMVPAWN